MDKWLIISLVINAVLIIRCIVLEINKNILELAMEKIVRFFVENNPDLMKKIDDKDVEIIIKNSK